ncbi:MAG: hypothetical protein HC906_17540 [Bacteroidales bacterium]|nr:hypothetical protein [Bacteroidales bacterium]
MKTAWSDEFYHHKDPTHDNGWDHIKLQYAEDCWVQSVIHENATSAIGLRCCKNCSVFDCQIIGNPGHNGFSISGFSHRNLIYNCKGGKQMHTYSIQDRVTANVFSTAF